MKTISELNEKMWYRAIKVIYIIFVGYCYLMATIIIGFAGYEIYLNHQDYQEDNQRYQNSFKKEDYDVLKSSNEKGIVEYGIVAGKSIEEINSALEKYRSNPVVESTSTFPKTIADLNGDYKVVTNVKFPENPQYPNTLMWSLGMFLLIPLCLFLAWLGTMIPRWIFYYVVLGTAKPK